MRDLVGSGGVVWAMYASVEMGVSPSAKQGDERLMRVRMPHLRPSTALAMMSLILEHQGTLSIRHHIFAPFRFDSPSLL